MPGRHNSPCPALNTPDEQNLTAGSRVHAATATTAIQFSYSHPLVIVAFPATRYYNLYNLSRVPHKNSSLLKPRIISAIVDLYVSGNLLQFVIYVSLYKEMKKIQLGECTALLYIYSIH